MGNECHEMPLPRHKRETRPTHPPQLCSRAMNGGAFDYQTNGPPIFLVRRHPAQAKQHQSLIRENHHLSKSSIYLSTRGDVLRACQQTQITNQKQKILHVYASGRDGCTPERCICARVSVSVSLCPRSVIVCVCLPPPSLSPFLPPLSVCLAIHEHRKYSCGWVRGCCICMGVVGGWVERCRGDRRL